VVWRPRETKSSFEQTLLAASLETPVHCMHHTSLFRSDFCLTLLDACPVIIEYQDDCARESAKYRVGLSISCRLVDMAKLAFASARQNIRMMMFVRGSIMGKICATYSLPPPFKHSNFVGHLHPLHPLILEQDIRAAVVMRLAHFLCSGMKPVKLLAMSLPPLSGEYWPLLSSLPQPWRVCYQDAGSRASLSGIGDFRLGDGSDIATQPGHWRPRFQ
jgi:hypothetical protein